MKKTGIIIIALIVIVIVALSSATYAFFTAGQIEFQVFVEGETGSVLTISLADENNLIRPAQTTSSINSYAAKSGDSGDFAVFILNYRSISTTNLNVTFRINEKAEYSGGRITNNSADYKEYLNDIIEFNFVRVPDDFTFSSNPDAKWDFLDDTSNTWVNPTSLWVKVGQTTGNPVFNFLTTESRNGHVLCYVRVNPSITDELIPGDLKGVVVKFKIDTQIENIRATT